jgi:hypothetical protein
MRNRETDDYDSKQLKREIQTRKDHLEKEYPVVVLDSGKVLEYGDIPREVVKKKQTIKRKRKMNWFNRHLNITLVISWLIGIPLLAYFFSTLKVMPMIITGIAILTVEFWYLKQKRKPLWNIILNFIPVIGWIYE